MTNEKRTIAGLLLLCLCAIGYNISIIILCNDQARQRESLEANYGGAVDRLATAQETLKIMANEIHSLRMYDFTHVMRAILRGCETYKVPVNVALSLICIESNFDPGAISNGGDYGLLQINKRTWEATADWSQILEPSYNINFGLSILKGYFARAGNWAMAAAMYNRGKNFERSNHPRKLSESIFMGK